MAMLGCTKHGHARLYQAWPCCQGTFRTQLWWGRKTCDNFDEMIDRRLCQVPAVLLRHAWMRCIHPLHQGNHYLKTEIQLFFRVNLNRGNAFFSGTATGNFLTVLTASGGAQLFYILPPPVVRSCRVSRSASLRGRRRHRRLLQARLTCR